MDKLIPEKAQGKDHRPVSVLAILLSRNTDELNLNTCNNRTQAMFIADMYVFAFHSKENIIISKCLQLL
jgi:hypothetical protein